MKVAIHITPTIDDHSVRGIGTYTEQLISQFKKGKWPVDFDFFQNPKSPPLADLIHYPYFDLFFHTLPFKKPCPTVVTIHDVIPLIFPKHFPKGVRGSINLFLQKRALKNVDVIICDSQTSRQDITANLSYPKDKIHVIYLAASQNFKKITDSKKLDKTIRKFKLFPKFVLYVGDVNWHKNIEKLLEAVKLANVKLVLVGSAFRRDQLIEVMRINQKINELGLQNNVIKTGFIKEDDLLALYSLAQVTLLPSFYEGFGLPVLESMACGTPVICSKVASLLEIGGDVATYCDPQDPQDMAAKINLIFNLESQQREEIGKKSQKHARSFTWEKVASQTIQVYKTVFKK